MEEITWNMFSNLHALPLLLVDKFKRNYAVELLKVVQFVSARRNWEDKNRPEY
jgi:hypothetical protein